MQILTNNLHGSMKNTCYLRESVVGEENAFHSIQGRAFIFNLLFSCYVS